MILTLCAAGCLLGSAVLFKYAFNFRIDAAPVGSMMIVASIVLAAASLLLFGIKIGTML
jgi:hypothetical protein